MSLLPSHNQTHTHTTRQRMMLNKRRRAETEITIIANVMRFRRLRVVAFSCFVYNFFLLFRQTTVSAPILMLPNPVPHRAKIVPKFIYLSFLVLFSSVDSYIYYYFVNSVYRFVVESLANGWLYFRIFSCLV